MYGHQVPRNHAEAMRLDKENGNAMWADAEHSELSIIFTYEAFMNIGHKSFVKPPPGEGYKRINVHFVYAVKHDGRYKAQLVAGGHLTDTPVDSVHSSVVPLRGDITTAVMTMSSYRAAPRKGHLLRARRIVGYLVKMDNKGGVVRTIRTEQPDYSYVAERSYNWDRSIYEGASEIIPSDVPEPLGKSVVLTSYVDGNLYQDMLTGRSVTGILHFVNKTPFDWYSKK
jgi:hypothetical protein